MRGKDNYMTVSVDDFRITPAYAGKSGSACLRCSDAEDHPRLCGEKQTAANASLHCLRITPAYAGKSCGSRGFHSGCWDHPRLCGEKIFSLFSHAPHTGSPPPMRGKATFFGNFSHC